MSFGVSGAGVGSVVGVVLDGLVDVEGAVLDELLGVVELLVLLGACVVVVSVAAGVLMSELLRVDLLQPAAPKQSAKAASVAAPVNLSFDVFMM